MRETFFRCLIKKHPEGQMLNKFQLSIRFILFPFQFICHNNNPYNPYTDVWTIHGKKYTGTALLHLAKGEGEIFKITQVNGCTTLERIEI